MTMDSGTKVKVIGGKHKGKWGFVKRAMPEFSFVVLKVYQKSISLGDDEDVCVDTEVRAKNIYLEVIPETVFEMPEASDLVELGPCDPDPPDWAKVPKRDVYGIAIPPQEPLVLGSSKPLMRGSEILATHPAVFEVVDSVIDELIAHKQMYEPPDNDDLLSLHSDEETVDITGVLPSVDEALSLAHKQMKHDDKISELEEVITDLSSLNRDMASSLELFLKLADLIKDKVCLD